MDSKNRLKPQDVVIALKIARHRDPGWKLEEIASAVRVSKGEVSHALKRLSYSQLYNAIEKRAIRQHLLEFLVHGVPYAFPAQLGIPAVGMPTAFAAKPLSEKLFASHEAAVWSSPRGSVRGRVVEPLYPSVPDAASADQDLYESLALVDALRVGRARERELAASELRRRLEE